VGPVLITGGTGGLGAVLARHLVLTQDVTELVLVSRRGPQAPGARDLVEELTGLGAAVQVVAADLSDRDSVAALLAKYQPASVVHAAGAVQDALVTSLSPQDLEVVFAAKVAPALLLDELTASSELTRFVVFSSLAGVLGNPGQGNYAAANAVLDALVRRRRAAGLAGLSLAWGPWAETGMTAGLSESDRRRMAREGTIALPVEQGLRLLDASMTVDDDVVIPAQLDLVALRGSFAGHLVRRTARAGRAAAPVGVPTRESLISTLTPQNEIARNESVLNLVREQVAVVCGHVGLAAIPPDRSFQDLGLESLAAIELRNRLTLATGLALSATLAFDHPTPRTLAGFLLSELGLTEVDGAAQLLSELDALERSLARADVEVALHDQVTARLDGLRRTWAGLNRAGGDGADDDLEQVSDSDMFDLLDNELGLG
jgi:NAD(P)-dependent dehydrogenase (short-subunit alcohol dehydrogenase family)